MIRLPGAHADNLTMPTGGFAALVPTPPRVGPRTPADVLDPALTIKHEEPGHTAAQVAEVLRVGFGWAPSPRTLQRLS